MKLFCRYLPIQDWGANYQGQTFEALMVASIHTKRAGKIGMGGAA